MKLKNILFGLFISMLFLGCRKDETKEQEDADRFIPRIFGEALLFPNGVQVVDAGQSVKFEKLQFSPAGQVSVKWKVNDKDVATGESYTFAESNAGDYRVKIEVTYGDQTISRYTDIFVIPQVNNYTPKTYNKVVLSYIGQGGDISRLNWDMVTHVAYKVATVGAIGTMDVAPGEVMRKAEELVTRAHLKGVRVLMGISGTLSADGWNTYNNNNFGNALTNVTRRAALVQAIKDYIAAKKMDGIDIMMTDLGNDVEATTTANVAALGPFVNELRAALGVNAVITLSVATNYTQSYYPNFAAASWINVHAFQDRAKIGPGRPLAQPSGFDFMVTSANLWKAKYPTSKLVIGIPAMGIRFTALDANGNNLNNTSFNYLPYRDILAADPSAHSKELAAIDRGCYFNGIPLVTQKANYLRDNAYLGAYIWQGDYDVSGEYSLHTAIFNGLK